MQFNVHAFWIFLNELVFGLKTRLFLYFAISAEDLHGNFLLGRDPKTIPVANELCGRDLVGEIFFLLLS